MLISRGIATVRFANLLKNGNKFNSVSIRNSHGPWSYRTASPPAKKGVVLTAELVSGFMWWWILCHFWTDYGHVIGEYEYPDSSKWTDEELGIPSN